MNKRKRMAHRRATLWDARALACPDDGLNFKRLFPDEWEGFRERYLAALVTGDVPGAEPLTFAPDDGSSLARFRADMARDREAGLVWQESEGVVTVTPIAQGGG